MQHEVVARDELHKVGGRRHDDERAGRDDGRKLDVADDRLRTEEREEEAEERGRVPEPQAMRRVDERDERVGEGPPGGGGTPL